MYPLKLKPAFKDYLWGGTKLKTDYNMKSSLSKLAEAWVLSCHDDGAAIVENGEFSGLSLKQAIEKMGDSCLGENGKSFKFFPILIKLIDAHDNLSIQVHPSDNYALEVEKEYGKTEMWYVVDCDKDAYLYYGFNRDISKDEFTDRIENATLLEVLNKVTVHKGDCFFIESGTIHAIGAGLLIAEIQQNSNTTYRVYDYGRVGVDGKPRQLHVDKAKDVTELGRPKHPVLHTASGSGDTRLANCKYFTVDRFSFDGERIVTVDEKSFSALLLVDGFAKMGDIELNAGDCVFIPASSGEIKLNGKATILESRV
ncbi:MAG: type I phosphomannose isomerase catalytic subunit [Oscillospiraceae bacterium]